MNYNNPVERLHTILTEISKAERNISLGEAWGKVFNLDPEEQESEIFYAIGDVIGLIKETRIKLLEIPDIDREVVLIPFKNIEKGFSNIRPGSDIDDLKRCLDTLTLTTLKLCAEIYKQKHGKCSIDEQELKALQEEVECLFKNILVSSLPEDLKIFLIDKLRLVRKAFEDIRLKGIEGLQQGIESCLGAAILNRELVNNPDENVRGFWSVLGRIGTLIGLVKDSKEVIESTAKVFIE